jgi:hypothetical protein
LLKQKKLSMASLVVLVNLTKYTPNTVDYAANLAFALHADLHLLHVKEDGEQSENSEAEDRLQLTSLKEDIIRRTEGMVACTICLQYGSVEPKLEEYCNLVMPLAVLTGTVDKRFYNHPVFDHLAIAIVQSPYPLIVIPATVKFRPIRKIMIAFEPAKAVDWSTISLSLLQELQTSFGCSFEIMIVTNRENPPNENFIRELKKIKNSLRELRPYLHFAYSASISEGISNYATIQNADWVVLFPSERTPLEFHKDNTEISAENSSVEVKTTGRARSRSKPFPILSCSPKRVFVLSPERSETPDW